MLKQLCTQQTDACQRAHWYGCNRQTLTSGLIGTVAIYRHWPVCLLLRLQQTDTCQWDCCYGYNIYIYVDTCHWLFAMVITERHLPVGLLLWLQ